MLMDRQILVFTSKRPLGCARGRSVRVSSATCGALPEARAGAARAHREKGEGGRLEGVLRGQHDAAVEEAALRAGAA